MWNLWSDLIWLPFWGHSKTTSLWIGKEFFPKMATMLAVDHYRRIGLGEEKQNLDKKTLQRLWSQFVECVFLGTIIKKGRDLSTYSLATDEKMRVGEQFLGPGEGITYKQKHLVVCQLLIQLFQWCFVWIFRPTLVSYDIRILWKSQE